MTRYPVYSQIKKFPTQFKIGPFGAMKIEFILIDSMWATERDYYFQY